MSNSHSQRRGRVPFFLCSTNLKRRMINLGLEIGGRRTTEGRWMQIQRSIFIDYEKRKFLQLEKISSSQIILCSMPKKHARCLLERPVTRPDWENLTQYLMQQGRCHLSSHACVVKFLFCTAAVDALLQYSDGEKN